MTTDTLPLRVTSQETSRIRCDGDWLGSTGGAQWIRCMILSSRHGMSAIWVVMAVLLDAARLQSLARSSPPWTSACVAGSAQSVVHRSAEINRKSSQDCSPAWQNLYFLKFAHRVLDSRFCTEYILYSVNVNTYRYNIEKCRATPLCTKRGYSRQWTSRISLTPGSHSLRPSPTLYQNRKRTHSLLIPSTSPRSTHSPNA